MRIMIDAPKDVDVTRSRVIEKQTSDPEQKTKLPKYYAEPELPEKYRKPKNIIVLKGK